jgi:hypothetical protein
MDNLLPQHVVIAYSHRDPAWMERVRATLRAEGLTVWTDEALLPGDPEWDKTVRKAIKTASSLVVILTRESAQSGWIQRQMSYAAEFGVRIFPLITVESAKSVIPATVDTADYMSIVDRDAMTIEVERLVAALRDQQQVASDFRASQPPGTYEPKVANRPLSRTRPADYVNVLKWTFLAPQNIAEYQESDYEPSLRAVGSWLINTICWIPLLIVALSQALATIPEASEAGALLVIVVIGGWFATGWLCETSDDTSTQVVGIIAAVAAAVLSLLMLHNVTLAIAFAAAIGIACGVGIGISDAIATDTMHGVAIGLAGGALLGAVFPLSARELAEVTSHRGTGFYLISVFIESGVFAMFLGASLAFAFSERVSSIIDHSLAVERQLSSSRKILITLFAAYAILIWLYLLGGWRFVTPRP